MDTLTKVFESNRNNVKELCLISQNGEILTFLSNYGIEIGDKNRIASSIMANIALGTRATKNILDNSITHITLKGEESIGYILFAKNNSYLYINVISKKPKTILKSFQQVLEDI